MTDSVLVGSSMAHALQEIRMDIFSRKDALRSIPSVQEILDGAVCQEFLPEFGRDRVILVVRTIIDGYRAACSEDFMKVNQIDSEQSVRAFLQGQLLEELNRMKRAKLKKVVNATGVVLHTNLGRAPLPKEAISIMTDAAAGYSNLEYDLETGSRGSRHVHIEGLVKELTGAEAALVVNNNAAAVFLCLNTLAEKQEVIISRGQQVEIGGSFRIPDIIKRSGAHMVEIGTTNKTHLADYESAITAETAMLLRVHTSNYKITGFTEEVTCKELARLGSSKKLIVMEDLGSGCLVDLKPFGLPDEPTVPKSLQDGASLITFSGDKLLGGPQAGIIAGKKELIALIKNNPLTRMVRCDKTTIAALSAVLAIYLSGEEAAREKIPTLRMIALTEDQLRKRALELEQLINQRCSDAYQMEIVPVEEEVGGGSVPGSFLHGIALAIVPKYSSINDCQDSLRKATVPVICKVHQDRLLLHVRTIQEGENEVIAQALSQIAGQEL